VHVLVSAQVVLMDDDDGIVVLWISRAQNLRLREAHHYCRVESHAHHVIPTAADPNGFASRATLRWGNDVPRIGNRCCMGWRGFLDFPNTMPESCGARLRQQREKKGVSLKAIAHQTKIQVSLLEGLEKDDITHWPAGIFRRAYVREYAQAIGLDPDGLV